MKLILSILCPLLFICLTIILIIFILCIHDALYCEKYEDDDDNTGDCDKIT